jgi:hypothetical protein
MAKRRSKGRKLPEHIMDDVCWAFDQTRYADRIEFDAAVQKYHFEITEEDDWKPDEVVLPCPRVRILFEDVEGERTLELTSDDGVSFTAGELLFKIHHALLAPYKDGNALVENELGDHVFFEGLNLEGEPAKGEPPTYEMWLGS